MLTFHRALGRRWSHWPAGMWLLPSKVGREGPGEETDTSNTMREQKKDAAGKGARSKGHDGGHAGVRRCPRQGRQAATERRETVAIWLR